jgi:hypothetical protein
MRRCILISALTLGLAFIAGPASAARIIVTIDGLHSAQGSCLCRAVRDAEQIPQR